MKKLLLYALLVLGFEIIFTKTNAQVVYININGGYGFPSGSQSVDDYKKEGTGSDYTINVSQFKYSLGKGINTNVGVGYLFNKNIGAEIGIGYLIGSKIEYHEITNSLYDMTVVRNYKSKMLYFTPSLVLESGFEKINLYTKVGIIIGFPRVTSEYIGTDEILNEKMEITTKYKMDLGLGINTSIGVLFNVSEKFSFFGECKIVNLTVTPKSSEYTKYSIGGFDQLWFLSNSEKEQVYEKDVKIDSSIPNYDEPTKLVKFKIPFGSVGANIGVKISF